VLIEEDGGIDESTQIQIESVRGCWSAAPSISGARLLIGRNGHRRESAEADRSIKSRVKREPYEMTRCS
jgi:hypothetical protein